MSQFKWCMVMLTFVDEEPQWDAVTYSSGLSAFFCETLQGKISEQSLKCVKEGNFLFVIDQNSLHKSRGRFNSQHMSDWHHLFPSEAFSNV